MCCGCGRLILSGGVSEGGEAGLKRLRSVRERSGLRAGAPARLSDDFFIRQRI